MDLLHNQSAVRHYFKLLGSEVTRILDGDDQPDVLGPVVRVDTDEAAKDELLAVKINDNSDGRIARVLRPAASVERRQRGSHHHTEERSTDSGHTIRKGLAVRRA